MDRVKLVFTLLEWCYKQEFFAMTASEIGIEMKLANRIRKVFRPNFSEKYARNFNPEKQASQGGEDGIIAEICRRLKIEKGSFVEFGAWDGVYCSNTYTLAQRGWSGVYIEGDRERAETLAKNLREFENCTPICSFIMAEGDQRLDAILSETALSKDFDLLSVDVDGNDYWLWKSLTDYQPKIVVIEYNSNFGPTESKTIPYDSGHMFDETMFYGASAAALNGLGREKGYTLVAYTTGLNLIFVRSDLAEGHFEPVQVESIPTRRLHVQRRREEFVDV